MQRIQPGLGFVPPKELNEANQVDRTRVLQRLLPRARGMYLMLRTLPGLPNATGCATDRRVPEVPRNRKPLIFLQQCLLLIHWQCNTIDTVYTMCIMLICIIVVDICYESNTLICIIILIYMLSIMHIKHIHRCLTSIA